MMLHGGGQTVLTTDGMLSTAPAYLRTLLYEKVMKKLSPWNLSASQPFSALEDPQFVKVLHMFSADFQVPNLNTIKCHILQVEGEWRAKIKSLLVSSKWNICFVTDA